MATQLDLQEQEQLDALKSFWSRYGNLVTWVLVLALAAFAGWTGWNYWQREQAFKAGAMFDLLDRASQAGDVERAARVFDDLRNAHPGTAFAQQGGLLLARLQFEKGQADAAKASLIWVADKGVEDEMRTIARLRLAGLQAEAKQYDDALKTLDAATAPGFEGLVADRRGDVLLAQGKRAEAIAAYSAAFKALSEKVDYRRLVEAKITALGGSTSTDVAAAAASSAAVASGAGK